MKNDYKYLIVGLVVAGAIIIIWSIPEYTKTSNIWAVIVPIVIFYVIYKAESIFGWTKEIRTSKRIAPAEILQRLETEEGRIFRERFIIPNHFHLDSVKCFKGVLYKFIIKLPNGKIKNLVTNAYVDDGPVFLSYYEYGDWLEEGFQTEKEFLNQLLPKDKINMLDVLENLPDDAKLSYVNNIQKNKPEGISE